MCDPMLLSDLPAVVDCGNLQNPDFGTVVLTGTTFGSTATYSCQNGYLLQGRTTRFCQASGDWSGEAPTCVGELRVVKLAVDDRCWMVSLANPGAHRTWRSRRRIPWAPGQLSSISPSPAYLCHFTNSGASPHSWYMCRLVDREVVVG